MSVNIGLYISASILCISCIIYRYLRRYRKTVERRVLSLLLWNVTATAVLDLVKNITASLDPVQWSTFNYIDTFLFFLLHSMLPPLFTYYILLLNGVAKNKTLKYRVCFFTPFIITEAFVLLTPLFDIIYYYDENGVYHRGNGVYVAYISAVLYMFIAVGTIIKTGKILRNRYMKGYELYFTVVVAGMVIQAIWPNIKVEAFTDILGLLGIMLTVDCNEGLIDEYTGLPNKASFEINAGLYLLHKYKCSMISLRFQNIKTFKNIIIAGHGDRVGMKLFSEIQSVTEGCEIYKYDEKTLVILVFEGLDKDRIAKDIEGIVEKTITLGEFNINLRTIISVASIPEDVDSIEGIERMAEYEPQSINKQVTILEGDSLDYIKREDIVEEAVYRAIAEKSFEVYYQPIWEKESGKIISCEALCRLNDSKLGFVPPSEFIPISERNGNIIAIGDIVFEKVCRDIVELDFEGIGIECVEVNLSLYQLLARKLTERYKEFLNKYGIPTRMINLEITETAASFESADFGKTLEELMEMGFSLSLDDYGTAYSNIENVLTVNYKNIKIDSKILWDSDSNVNFRNLLGSTIASFRKMGNNIIQEGVETKEQLDFVTEAGANLIQGYYFSKPLRRDEFVKFVKKFNNV
jgi:EAL domain-containing protein (putative c-di-GMP-specific phosphodiesterase class I)